MRVFGKADAAEMKTVEERFSKSKARIMELDAQKVKFAGRISDDDKLLGESDMAERREKQERLRRMEECRKPRRKTRSHQQER